MFTLLFQFFAFVEWTDILDTEGHDSWPRKGETSLCLMSDPISRTPIAEEVRTFQEDCMSSEMADVYRRKTPTERLQIGFGMWRAAHKLVSAGVRREHPEWSDEDVSHEIARRLSHGFV